MMQLVAVSVIALTLLTGADGKGCSTGEDTHPNAPQQPGPNRGGPPPKVKTPDPKPGDPEPHHTVIVRAGEVEAVFLPATIVINASPIGFSHDDIMTTSNSQKWSFEVPVGITITVYVQLKPGRVGSKSGWCSIEVPDLKLKDGPRLINGAWFTTCNLVIPA